MLRSAATAMAADGVVVVAGRTWAVGVFQRRWRKSGPLPPPRRRVRQPFEYYEILGLERDSKAKDIKRAYFRLAKLYHPDMTAGKKLTEEERAEMNRKFEDVNEAYTMLMDSAQRDFYDQYGYTSDDLKKQDDTRSDLEYEPKYPIYRTSMYAQGEATPLDKWFREQGHSRSTPDFYDFRQRARNAYVEFKYGMMIYNFPWHWNEFLAGTTVFIVCSSVLALILGHYVEKQLKSMPDGHPEKPVRINDSWRTNEPRDILQFTNIRPGVTRPLGEFADVPGKTSEYRDSLRSNAARSEKARNKKRHERRMREALAREKQELKERKMILEGQRDHLNVKIKVLEQKIRALEEGQEAVKERQAVQQ